MSHIWSRRRVKYESYLVRRGSNMSRSHGSNIAIFGPQGQIWVIVGPIGSNMWGHLWSHRAKYDPYMVP